MRNQMQKAHLTSSNRLPNVVPLGAPLDYGFLRYSAKTLEKPGFFEVFQIR